MADAIKIKCYFCPLSPCQPIIFPLHHLLYLVGSDDEKKAILGISLLFGRGVLVVCRMYKIIVFKQFREMFLEGGGCYGT